MIYNTLFVIFSVMTFMVDLYLNINRKLCLHCAREQQHHCDQY